MRFTCTRAAMAATLVCGLGATALADQPQSELAQLRQEMAQLREANQQLQSQVGALRGEHDTSWLNQRRAQEVKALVHEVLSDADTRASMQSNGITAGYNRGFFLASEDGKFRLQVGGQVQFRYILNVRDDAPGQDNTEGGFQLRRTKVRFSGHIGSPKIGFNINTAYNRDNAGGGVEEAKLTYKIADNFTLEAGRYKQPYMREETTSSSRQLTVERSLFNETFTNGFSEGIGFRWDATDALRLSAMLHDGLRAGEIGAGSDFHNDDSDFGVTARVDVKLAGKWGQMADTSAWSGEDFAAFVGGAVYYDKPESGQFGQRTRHRMGFTADTSIESNGFGFFAAVAGDHIGGTDGTGNYSTYGGMAQVSYMVIPDKLEPFVRAEYIKYNTPSFNDEVKIVTIGANYYLAKHNAKFTVDAVWSMDPIGGSSGLGLLGDSNNNDDQLALRAQFQLLF